MFKRNDRIICINATGFDSRLLEYGQTYRVIRYYDGIDVVTIEIGDNIVPYQSCRFISELGRIQKVTYRV